MNETSFLAEHQQVILIGGGVALLFLVSVLFLQSGPPSRTVRWARAMIVLSVLAAIGGITWVWVGHTVLYRSVGYVRIAPKVKFVFDSDEDTTSTYAQLLETEACAICSPQVIQAVLTQKEVWNSAWCKEILKCGEPGALHREVQKCIKVTPRAGTEMIAVSFAAADPKEARTICMALLEQYFSLTTMAGKKNDTVLEKRLLEEQNRLQSELDGLMKTRFAVAATAGGSEPEQLRLRLSADEAVFAERIQDKRRELELKRWELEQHQPATTQPALTPSRGNAGLTVSPGDPPNLPAAQSNEPRLLFEIDRLRCEIELMVRDQEEKRARLRQLGKTVHELARYDDQIRQKRELYEQVRVRHERLQMEDNRPRPVSIFSPLTPSDPFNDERLTWTTLIAVGLVALVLVFRSIARSAAGA